MLSSVSTDGCALRMASAFAILSRGKPLYAVGSNRSVALLSGIRVGAVKIGTFILVGLSASIAGNMLLARIGAIQADTARGLELEVIAAVVIGGASLTAGQGNIMRTIVGVFVIVLIRNFVNLARIKRIEDYLTSAGGLFGPSTAALILAWERWQR